MQALHSFRSASVAQGRQQPGRPLNPTSPVLRVPALRRSTLTRAVGKEKDPLEQPCPVPKEQQPLFELKDLQASTLFDWASLPPEAYALRLGGVFFASFMTLSLPVSAVTFNWETEPVQLLAASAIGSLFVTLVLVLRMYLGYNHVGSRLLSATVEYEETGWYDGQVWVKTPQMLMRDRLVGTYQVKPILARLQGTLLGLSGAMAAAVLLLIVTPAPNVSAASSGVDSYVPSSVQPRSQADYEESVATYEPWALEEEDAEQAGMRSSILDHMRR